MELLEQAALVGELTNLTLTLRLAALRRQLLLAEQLVCV